MEFMAEFTEGISRDRARSILKRQRTTRHKPSSFFGMHSSTSGSDSDHCLIDSNDQSVVTSSKEDEDMANCLIMLARSGSPVTKEEKSDQIRRKFVEIDATKEKSGCYVYECKTCNRSFPSFQALGGHRASHKKPKVNVEEKKLNSVHMEEEDEDNNNSNSNSNSNKKAVVVVEEEDEENKAKSIAITTNNNSNNIIHKSPSQTRIICNNNMKATKVHECSICGSEFLSGQALGGHMRKHRPIVQTNNNNRTGISTTSNDSSGGDQVTEKETSPAMLSLDLNFPPPEVVEEHRSTFMLTGGGSSQQRMVFSASPAFVDCHY